MLKVSFINYLSTEKRYSENTLTAYRTDIDQFFAYLMSDYQIEDISQVSYQIIRSWVVSLMNNNISAKSINRKISALKTFYRYLRKEGIIANNPLQHIISPRTGKKLPEFLNQEQMNSLFDDVGFSEGFSGARDRLIIEILYFTGMRLSELTQLKDSDTDLFNRQFKVLGKGNKERLIPFSKILHDSITGYLQIRNSVFENKDERCYLLVTDKGRKINSQFVYRVVNRYLALVSTLKKRSPHVLRHTFATHMLNNGADLNSIKEILGHASLAATQVYTHNSIEKLKTVYNQAHPRA